MGTAVRRFPDPARAFGMFPGAGTDELFDTGVASGDKSGVRGNGAGFAGAILRRVRSAAAFEPLKRPCDLRTRNSGRRIAHDVHTRFP